MRPRLSLAPVVFFCLGFAFVTQPAAGQDNTWQGAANVIDFFSNAGEWSLGVPDGSTNITIPQGGVLGDTSFTNSQTLTIGAPAELVLLSGTTVANGSVVDNGTLSINSGATLSNNLGTFGGTGTYLNSGTIQGAGQIGSSTLGFPTLVNQAGGTINANVSGQQLKINGVFTANAGVMEATGGGKLNFSNGIIANQGGTIAANGGIVNLDFSSITGGTITADGGVTLLESTESTITGGTITALNGGLVSLDDVSIVGGTLNNVSGNIGGQGTTLDGSTAAGAVTIQGNYIAGFTPVLGTINNQGNIQTNNELKLAGNTTLQGGGTVTLGGGAAIDGTQVLTNVDNTIQGAGVIGDSFGGFPTLVNQAGGTINANVSGQVLNIFGVLTSNAGLMEATGGGVLNLNGSPLTNAGTVRVDAVSGLLINAPFTQTAGKTQVDGFLITSQGENVSGGSVLGTGTIYGNVAMTGGAMQPGGPSSPGALVINGNYDSNAAFNELINGSGNGLLVVNGSSTLESGALLNIDLLGGFTPFVGETFTLMDFFSGTGTFANAPATGFVMDGFNWTIAYNATDIVLDAGSPVSTTLTPEPGSFLLLITGLAGLTRQLQRKRSVL